MNLIEGLKVARFLVEDCSCFRHHKMDSSPDRVCCEFREFLLAETFIWRYRSCLKGDQFSIYADMETTAFHLKQVFHIQGFFQFHQRRWCLVWEITLTMKTR